MNLLKDFAIKIVNIMNFFFCSFMSTRKNSTCCCATYSRPNKFILFAFSFSRKYSATRKKNVNDHYEYNVKTAAI